MERRTIEDRGEISVSSKGRFEHLTKAPETPVAASIPMAEKIKNFVVSFFRSKEALGQSTETLTAADEELITKELEDLERIASIEGVDFSRIQIDKVLADREAGKRIEFETFSPYLCDYSMTTGEIWDDRLLQEDAIGLKLAGLFRKIFPQARLISLYDEYNSSMPDSENERSTAGTFKDKEQATKLLGEEAYKKNNSIIEWRLKGAPYKGDAIPQIQFDEKAKDKFKAEVRRMLVKSGGIRSDSEEGKDYLLISESSKQKDAEVLVQKLEAAGFIERDGGEILFVNPRAENPLYRKIQLRTASGRWLCEALDASSYIKLENFEITHVVVLPESFKEQQNKVWEMLRCLGIEPLNYHNIFYDGERSPEDVAKTIEGEFAKYEH